MDPSPLTAAPELQWSAVLSILLLSIAVPAAIFLGRNNVRSIRRDLVRDLVNLTSLVAATCRQDAGGTLRI